MSTIVSAVGVAVANHNGASDEMVKKIEMAMSQAVSDAHANGISDPDEIRTLMLIARDKVRNEVGQ